MLTLTFRDAVTPSQASCRWRRYLRRVPRGRRGRYVVVFERSEPASRIHLHVLVHEDDAEVFRSAWRHGHTDQVRGDPLGLANYISKGFQSPHRPFSRRYFAARGTKPQTLRTTASGALSVADLIHQVSKDTAAEATYIDSNAFVIYGRHLSSPQ